MAVRSMVCRRMGLLDDAIREHLELKRLRGADPGLVSREEQDAFGPVRGGEPADAGEPTDARDDITGTADEDAPPSAHDPAQPDGFSNVGQETAELDMRVVLKDESDRDATATGPSDTGPVGTEAQSGGATQEQGTTDESLEWEMPGDGRSEQPGPRGADSPPGDAAEEPVEDVLEETPDFLRDTPEQERLWFEQRPPRDFDFDK